jgi:hypothetical protein
MSDIVAGIIGKLKEDMLASPVDDVTIISRPQLETLEAELSRLRAALVDERKRALEGAWKAIKNREAEYEASFEANEFRGMSLAAIAALAAVAATVRSLMEKPE